MPTDRDEDLKNLTFSVGRLAGAVEALTSRLNRTDDFIDKHFSELNTTISTLFPPLIARVTVIEAQRGRFSYPASGIGAIAGALVGAFTAHFLGK